MSSTQFSEDEETAPILTSGFSTSETNIDQDNAKQPSDRDPYRIVYWIFVLLGMGSLTPYNAIITANEFYSYKLRNVSAGNDWGNYTTDLQNQFESYFATFSTGAMFAMIFGNTLLVRVINHKTRLSGALVLVALFFLPIVVTVKVNSDHFQTGFLVLTIASVVLMNLSSAIVQGGTFGVAAMLPVQYAQAAMTGQAMAGIFVSLLQIICIAIFTNPEDAALLYFSCAEFILFITFIGCVLVNYIRFYRVHTSRIEASFGSPSEKFVKGKLFKETALVFRKTLPFGLSVCSVFFVTLLIFPNFISQIQPVSGGTFAQSRYWAPVTCFLLFNSGDFIGRVLAGVFKSPRSKSMIGLLALTRFGFIVLYLFTNFANTKLPVYFYSDVYTTVFCLVLAVSNGYLGTLCMMFGPISLERPELQEQAGSVLSFWIALGLSSGSALSFLYVQIPTW